MRIFMFMLSALLLVGCGSSKKVATTGVGGMLDYGSPNVEQKLRDSETFVVNEVSKDKTYGYTVENPIMVGKMGGSGPKNERRFLNALAGPNGEEISYHRIGSCCEFISKNGLLNDVGIMDKYAVTYEGLKEEIVLYINMYDSDVLKIPVGFKKKKI